MMNSATQTSLRVRWNLFSDDTVEFYELFYRPVLEDLPADTTHGTDGVDPLPLRPAKHRSRRNLPLVVVNLSFESQAEGEVV